MIPDLRSLDRHRRNPREKILTKHLPAWSNSGPNLLVLNHVEVDLQIVPSIGRRLHLLGDAADSRSLHLSICIQEDVVRDTTHAVFLHLRRPLAVVHVQEHEVDLVLELLLHRKSGRNLLLANLAPAGIESAPSSQHSET